jgi:putative transposon-encoded protein
VSKRRIKLPGKKGKLLLPKNGDLEKLRAKYPEDKFSLTAVTADGTPLGFLLQKIKKDDLTLANEVVAMIEKKKKV